MGRKSGGFVDDQNVVIFKADLKRQGRIRLGIHGYKRSGILDGNLIFGTQEGVRRNRLLVDQHTCVVQPHLDDFLGQEGIDKFEGFVEPKRRGSPRPRKHRHESLISQLPARFALYIHGIMDDGVAIEGGHGPRQGLALDAFAENRERLVGIQFGGSDLTGTSVDVEDDFSAGEVAIAFQLGLKASKDVADILTDAGGQFVARDTIAIAAVVGEVHTAGGWTRGFGLCSRTAFPYGTTDGVIPVSLLDFFIDGSLERLHGEQEITIGHEHIFGFIKENAPRHQTANHDENGKEDRQVHTSFAFGFPKLFTLLLALFIEQDGVLCVVEV